MPVRSLLLAAAYGLVTPQKLFSRVGASIDSLIGAQLKRGGSPVLRGDVLLIPVDIFSRVN